MAAGGPRRAALMRWLVLLALVACSGGVAGEDVEEAARTTTSLQAESDLLDGTYFGFVTALDPATFRLVFDEAELLEGDDAVDAAAADGGVVTEGGSYVRNPEVTASRVTLAEDIEVRVLVPCCELHAVSFEDWHAGFEPDDRTFYGTSRSHYELTVEDGRAVTVDEVLVP